MSTGELIKRYREKNCLSQQTVADFLGIQRVALSYYETNDRQAPLDILEKLADLYGAELVDFFETNEDTINQNIAFAFRSEGIAPGDLEHLSAFNKAVKNYFKICELEFKNGDQL